MEIGNVLRVVIVNIRLLMNEIEGRSEGSKLR